MPNDYRLSLDQFDQISLPLGKALSVLELFVDDLPFDQANAGYVAQDLIKEAKEIARSFTPSSSGVDTLAQER